MAEPKPKRTEAEKAAAAKKHRNDAAKRSRDNYESVSEIGDLPAVKDPGRREACRLDLFEDLRVYYPRSTGKNPFSNDHRKIIDRMQSSVIDGLEVWNCVFRGFAKTSIAVGTVIWALKYGHRHFIPFLAANKRMAVNLLRMVKTQFETNERLFEDFPEICYPVRRLEGRNQRCAQQSYHGELTRIQWTSEEIWLPAIEGSEASSGIVSAFGITGALNGLVRTLPTGENIRPDWWLADDLQTRQTARSPGEVEKGIDALQHSVMMLGGHDEDIGGCVNGTLFKPNDLMQQLADPDLFPSFSGEIVPMVKVWPDSHESFWLTDYARVLKDFDPKLPGDKKRAMRNATALYESRRKEADGIATKGVCTWDHCFSAKKGEISALQHAYNILILQGEEVFSTECQQKIYIAPGDAQQLELTDVILKLSGLKHREVPTNATKLVCYIDTQDESFWYVVIAWTADFTGYVIDYGVWPDQNERRDISKNHLAQKLSQKYSHLKNREAIHRAGLKDLCEAILGREWIDSSGAPHKIAAAFVDVADGDVRKTIPSWIVGQKKWRTILRPAVGVGVRPSETPFAEKKKDKKKEKRRGMFWREEVDPSTPGGVIVYIDTNSAKTFTANRWRAGGPRPADDPTYRPCEPGALYLWGMDPRAHSTYGNHQCCEFVTRMTTDKGRTVDQWEKKPNQNDNEHWDCTVGAIVLADLAGGVSLKNTGLKTTVRKRRKRSKKVEYLN